MKMMRVNKLLFFFFFFFRNRVKRLLTKWKDGEGQWDCEQKFSTVGIR